MYSILFIKSIFIYMHIKKYTYTMISLIFCLLYRQRVIRNYVIIYFLEMARKSLEKRSSLSK